MIAPSSPPVVAGPISDDPVLAYLASQPDALLIAWLSMSPQAADVLTQRERDHAAGLLSTSLEAAARYVRERLRSGDHAQAAARQALDMGAVITLGRRRYTVTGRRGEYVTTLRGERNGKAELCRPLSDVTRWWLCTPGLWHPGNKVEGYRRNHDGTFTAAK